MEEIISLQEIFNVLKKRIAFIIFVIILGVSVAGVYTFFVVTPQYKSQAQLIARLPQDDLNNTIDVNVSLQLINTYKDLITSDTVLKDVQQKMQEEYGQEISISALRSSLKVIQSQNSQMFSISSTTIDPILSERIANQTALIFQETAQNTLNIDKITIISNASANTLPVSPDHKSNLIIGILGGLLFGLVITLLLEFFDRTIKNEQFITEELELPLLGVVPYMTPKELNVKITRKLDDSSVYPSPNENDIQTNNKEEQLLRRKRTRI